MTSKGRVLIADNDSVFLTALKEHLTERGYDVITAENREEGRQRLLEPGIALGVIDYRLERQWDEEDHSGVNLASETSGPFSTPKIILTMYGENVHYIINALKPRQNGYAPALDYVSKYKTLSEIAEIIERAIARKRVFLCYSRPDQSHIEKLYDELQNCGLDPWMDRRLMVGGETWAQVISQQVRHAHSFVACISKSSDTGGFREQEITWGLEVDQERGMENYFIPLRLEECEPGYRYRHKNCVDLFGTDGLGRLVAAIRGVSVAGGAGGD